MTHSETGCQCDGKLTIQFAATVTRYIFISLLALALAAIACRDTGKPSAKTQFKQTPAEIGISILSEFSGDERRWYVYDEGRTGNIPPAATNVYGLNQSNISNLVAMINMLPLRNAAAAANAGGTDASVAVFKCTYGQSTVTLFYDYRDHDRPAGKFKDSGSLMRAIEEYCIKAKDSTDSGTRIRQ